MKKRKTNTKNKKEIEKDYWIIAILLTIIILGLIFLFLSSKGLCLNKKSSQIANPASVYCIENGGHLEIRTDENIGEYGVCIKNGKECEEWAFFTGECNF